MVYDVFLRKTYLYHLKFSQGHHILRPFKGLFEAHFYDFFSDSKCNFHFFIDFEDLRIHLQIF